MLRKDWLTLTSDSQLWSFLEIPRFFTNQQFLEQVNQVKDHIEELDCSRGERLTQEAFVQLSRDKIQFPKLRKLTMPTGAVLPNLVYECMAVANCFPALEELSNVTPNDNNTCEPIRCQAYFKQSKLKVLHDQPVAVYGRLKRPVGDQTADKQKRQKWEGDLAKAAISCQHIVQYKCWRSANYLDDKSIEKLSVLFPNLQLLELHHCLVSEEGFTKFLSHNRDGCLRHLILDRAPGLTDSVLTAVADRCSSLETLSLSRCGKVTAAGVRYLLGKCRQLKRIKLNTGPGSSNYSSCGCSSCICTVKEGSSCCPVGQEKVTSSKTKISSNDGVNNSSAAVSTEHINDSCLIAISETCLQLEELTLQNSSSLGKAGISALRSCKSLKAITFHSCSGLDDSCLDQISQMTSLSSVTIVNCSRVTPAGIIDLILSSHWLTSFTFGCSDQWLDEKGGQRFDCDMSDLAEHAYDRLSGSETGCLLLSNIKHLSLTGPIGGRFFNLCIILCSGLTNLSFHCHPVEEERKQSIKLSNGLNSKRANGGNLLAKLSDIQNVLANFSSDLIGGGEEGGAELAGVTAEDLIEMVISSRKLRSLELSGVTLNDKFLYTLCEHADHLRYLALHDGAERLSLPAFNELIRLTPSLARLLIGRDSSGDSRSRLSGGRRPGVDPEELLGVAQKLHRGRCFLHLEGRPGGKVGVEGGSKGDGETTEKKNKTDSDSTRVETSRSENQCRSFEISFTPLKFLGLFDGDQ